MRTLFLISREHKILILFTPQTPRSKVIFLQFSIFFFLSFSVYSQFNIQESIKKNFDNALNRTMEIELKNETYYSKYYLLYADSLLQFQLREQNALKKKWWYYLPNLGFSFGKPSISFGTSILGQIDFENQKRKIQKEKILKTWEHETSDNLKLIQTTVRKIELEKRELELLNSMYLYERIFINDSEISEKAGLITEIEFLQKQKTFHEYKFKVFQKEKSIFSMIKDLEILSHCHDGFIQID